MRDAIDSYTVDKQKAPQSLDDLVQAGYLKAMPDDPFTHRTDTWIPVQEDTLMSLDQTESGIDDVHSGAQDDRLRRHLLQHLVSRDYRLSGHRQRSLAIAPGDSALIQLANSAHEKEHTTS